MTPIPVIRGPKNLLAIIRGSERRLREVIRGDSTHAQAAANVYVDVMRDELRRPGTGRVYEFEFRMIRVKGSGSGTRGQFRPVMLRNKPRTPHRASAPGNPPANDTMTLSNALGTAVLRVQEGRAVVAVGVAREGFYWEFLEYGTRLIEPRPFVRPAIAIARAGAADAYRASVVRKMRRVIKARNV